MGRPEAARVRPGSQGTGQPGASAALCPPWGRGHVRGRSPGRGEAATLPRAGHRACARKGVCRADSPPGPRWHPSRGARALPGRAGGRRSRPRRETRAAAPRPGASLFRALGRGRHALRPADRSHAHSGPSGRAKPPAEGLRARSPRPWQAGRPCVWRETAEPGGRGPAPSFFSLLLLAPPRSVQLQHL